MTPGPLPWPRTLVRALFLALLCLGCASSSPDKRLLQYLNDDGFGNRYVGNSEEQNYLTLGDTVTISDSLHPELGRTEVVQPDGTVLLHIVGAAHVAGMTRSELEAFLLQKYSPYYDELDLQVRLGTQGKWFYVVGEVAAKGRKPFPGDLTVFQAVMDSNPDARTANLGRVQVIRADPRDPLIIPVNISDILRGDSTFNVHVQERDIVYVPPTMIAQFGYFLSGLIFPITEVVRQLAGAFFIFNRNAFNRRGGGANRFY